MQTASRLGRRLEGFRRLGSVSPVTSPLSRRPTNITFVRTRRAQTTSYYSKPRDLSLPNSSWGSEMMRSYEHYNSQCEVELEGGGKREGPWRRLPSYDRFSKERPGRSSSTKTILPKARFYIRNIRELGAAFEFVIFDNTEEQKCVGIFQCGHLLEGPPGHVHGGATATMVDTVIGIHANRLSGPSVTVSLNINYYSVIPLGSTVLIESSLDKKEGRKTFLSCKVTNTDGSKVYTKTTALFLVMEMDHLTQEA
ncbi:acyl-coenzyme A thioesterase THEM4 [Brachionichthys hirsutus]|uniref:acyl-coenzyme A thioesterase THEM4 n=1 Tax=Brachionichthys hirsutus TaxID=412623 RepID=UPI00360470F0